MKELQLTQGQVALIDDEDWERVNLHKWCARWDAKSRQFMPVRSMTVDGRTRTVYLSRFIVEAPPDLDVDHVDHNWLNATRQNLRICTTRQNMQNRHKRSANPFKGITRYRDTSRWIAQINDNGHAVNLGIYPDAHAAALAYDAKAREVFGEFALTNF